MFLSNLASLWSSARGEGRGRSYCASPKAMAFCSLDSLSGRARSSYPPHRLFLKYAYTQ